MGGDDAHEAALRFTDAWRDQGGFVIRQSRDGTLLLDTTHEDGGGTVRLTEPQLRAVLAENARMRQERDQYASAYHRLDSDQAAAGSYALRAERAEAERDEARARLASIAATQRNAWTGAIDRLRADARAAAATAAASSATQTDAEGTRAREDANSSASTTAAPSEPEDARDAHAWCWALNPNGPLRCGRLKNHPMPHQRGERTWTDETGPEQ